MIKRVRFEVCTDDCRTQKDVNARIESDIEKRKFREVINIQERNMNDSYYEIVVYCHTEE